ncbi:tripartite tricarboxylate transporter permease [Natronobiforma cellulositropha]|uniref:tripartite tricarboxylate transporter permease n=1 Tax=Natronobiforma cellulositropha TaxID=1679076 RepID=UPI0021D5CC75|nr:tripartite tricarboxylate transporter permease [Natronobiforma cellulositropha]
MTFAELVQGFEIVFSWPTLVYVFIGICLGIVLGAIPGLGAIIGIAILLPISAPLGGGNAIILFISIYLGALYGGSVAAILLNAPGTASAAATTFDGYPMSRRGLAKTALASSAVSSSIGGLISIAILFLLVPFLTTIVLAFGTPEYLLVAVLGLAMITVVSGDSMVKGITVGSFGLMITSIGIAPMSANFRYPISMHLYDGISFAAVLIGLFAVAEMIKLSGEGGSIAKNTSTDGGAAEVGSILDGAKETVTRPLTVAKSAVIGMAVGAMPGAGASVSNFIAYAEAMRSDPDPGTFGTGNIRGVISSEASNSATCAGSLIPTLSFGIPGSGVTALLLGALLMHGLQPGPDLFSPEAHLATTYSFFVALLIGNVIIVIVGLALMTRIEFVTKINTHYLVPIVMVLAIFGSLGLRGNFMDIITVFLFGILGYFIVQHNYSVIALVLGVVLGPIVESNLYRSFQISGGSPWIFVDPGRPISLSLTLMIVAILLLPFVVPAVKRRLNRS